MKVEGLRKSKDRKVFGKQEQKTYQNKLKAVKDSVLWPVSQWVIYTPVNQNDHLNAIQVIDDRIGNTTS